MKKNDVKKVINGMISFVGEKIMFCGMEEIDNNYEYVMDFLQNLSNNDIEEIKERCYEENEENLPF